MILYIAVGIGLLVLFYCLYRLGEVWLKTRKATIEDIKSRTRERDYLLLLTHIEKAVRAAEAVSPPEGTQQAYLSGGQKRELALAMIQDLFPEVSTILVRGLIECEVSYLENELRGRVFTRPPSAGISEPVEEPVQSESTGEQ